jgi:hypothetical protein
VVQLGLFIAKPLCKVCGSTVCKFRSDPRDVTASEEERRVFGWWCVTCYCAAELRANL